MKNIPYHVLVGQCKPINITLPALFLKRVSYSKRLDSHLVSVSNGKLVVASINNVALKDKSFSFFLSLFESTPLLRKHVLKVEKRILHKHVK